MVKAQNVASLSILVVFALVGTGVRAGIEDVLAGLSTPELNDLLQDLEFSDNEYDSNVPPMDYNIGNGVDGDYFLPEDVKHVQLRSNTDGAQQIKGQASPSSAAAAAATAMLPAYCDPPNPCPPGYTGSEGCIEDFENTSEFSRSYQSTQNCICDTEHMFNCPSSNGAASRSGESPSRAADILAELTSNQADNPFLSGQKLPVAAKKGMGYQ